MQMCFILSILHACHSSFQIADITLTFLGYFFIEKTHNFAKKERIIKVKNFNLTLVICDETNSEDDKW